MDKPALTPLLNFIIFCCGRAVTVAAHLCFEDKYNASKYSMLEVCCCVFSEKNISLQDFEKKINKIF